MQQARNTSARLTLSLLATAAVAAGATALYQVKAAPTAAPEVVGAWNATFSGEGYSLPSLLVFHTDGTLLMSGVEANGSSITVGSWRALQNGEVALEARVLGAEKGRYLGQVHLHGKMRVRSGQLVGSVGGEAVMPNGQVAFKHSTDTVKAFRIVPGAK